MRDADDLSEDPWDRSFKAHVLLSAPLVVVVAVAGWAAVGSFDGRAATASEYPIKMAVTGLPSGLATVMASTGLRSQPARMAASEQGVPTATPGLAPTPSTDSAALDRGVRLAAVLPQPVEASPKANFDKASGLLVSDFNLGAGASSSNAIDTRKPVLLNGRAAGTILIRIGAASQVYVRQSDLSALLTGKLSAAFAGGAEFITLDQIRDHGVNVHYDASRDELLITT